jgi:ABC-2 type transport system ATP-binding protein
LEREILMEYILTTDNLTKIYGTKRAADAVSLHIKKGDVYGLIGRNGAGKTTILKMICGLSCPSSGSITFRGKTGAALSKEMNKIGSLIETPGLFPKMSAYQNIKIKCILCGKNNDDYIKSLLKQVGLEKVGKKPTQSFSLGMKQRLGIALALVGDPEFIVLDEPINGLDPQGIAEMREIIHRLSKERGMTVIVSSHILDELAKVADAFGIINDGKLIDEFTAEELEARCSKYTILKAGEFEKTKKVLADNGLSQYEVLETGDIRINGEIEDTSKLIAVLVGAGVPVYELASVQGTLEQYYLNRTGGKV